MILTRIGARMNQYGILFSNMLIFGIGTILSKGITFFLLPLQTYALSKNEYGTVDLILNISALLVPVFSIGITEAAMRFPLEEKYNKNEIFSVVLLIPMVGGCLLTLILNVSSALFHIEQYKWILICLYVTTIYKDVLMSFCKGIDKNFIYSICGVIYTLVIIFLNYIFLIHLNWSINGYFFAVIIANLASALFVFIFGKLYLFIRVRCINWGLTKEILLYSWPLLSNSLAWWITTLSNRYIIAFYLGVSAAGIFSVANKIPLIPITIIGIFQQAWQLSAIKEISSLHSGKFFSEIYGLFLTLLCLLTSLMFFQIDFLASVLFQKEFYVAWKYVPILLIGSAVSCISGFWGVVYAGVKKTKNAFYSTLFGSIGNFVFNILLIPKYGINGAAVSMILSYSIVSVYRIFDVKKYVISELYITKTLLSFLILFVQSGVVISEMNNAMKYNAILFLCLCFIHKKNLTLIFNKIVIYFKNYRIG